MNDATRQWREWQRTPWGRLHYTQANANLARHLPPAPATVLDLAGGDGADALRPVRAGHRVTVVDRSAEMLADAEHAFAEAGLPVRLVHADLADLPVRGPFDVVLAHNVIQYLPDPASALRTALTLVAPGGLLSVIALNRHSEPLRRATMDLDPAAALAALDTDQARTRTFDTTLTLHTADQVVEWLDGCVLLGHYGINAVTGYVADNDRKHDPAFFADLERLELALADRMPHPMPARFFHLVFRRGNPGDGGPGLS
ncbi:methyltransferase domain-containing protein [Saccharothrix sp. S26]|uniref:class I SAM-dependent methyltransferase n=1 Tax=Saccharothrix sp. S26 TaxID=2907215 RepID=UPI001F234FA2|nr:methyltransferase domain-containing protein [Saccharothrix sp. S26]MCE6995105.1 methyltransferase domain-containing protein [Saccharothrix sp. S26]